MKWLVNITYSRNSKKHGWRIFTSYHVVSSRLFEDKVYLAVLAKGINIKKNKWAQEDGRDPQETEDLETKIADKVKMNQFQLIFHISVKWSWWISSSMNPF